MNILDNTVKEQQISLPPLVKGSTTYKLKVPRKVEEKIRYLCRKFSTLEWSGILFTSYEGNFEDGSLVITCQDLYPMDLGTSTYTDFKMDESVAGYIAENIELFGCDMNLIHSHNQMSCFFSGTDTSTLRSEGNDQNCFVSLIVNNAGTYCAAITRKVQEKKTIVTKNYSSTYEFFGEGEKTANVLAGATENTEVENTYIEYFMLDVEIEHVDNPLAYLDTRFDEIQESKKKKATVNPSVTNPPVGKAANTHSSWVSGKSSTASTSSLQTYDVFDDDYSFRDYLNKQRETKELTLFSEDEMEEMTDTSKWNPDPTIIHKLVCQMVTCSLIVSDDIDLKQWITRWMNKKYEEIFNSESTQFEEWKEFIVDFMLNQYMIIEKCIPDIDYDLLQSKIAGAIHDELYQYCPDNSNPYIKDYMEVLTRYIYE